MGPKDADSVIIIRYAHRARYLFLSYLLTQRSVSYRYKNNQGSEELFQLVDENEQTNSFAKVIKKAMQYDQQKGDAGYFTKNDFEYILLMRPKEG